MHERGKVDCNQGYEWWLIKEAKKRNPSILLYALSWGVPYWVGNGSYFSQDNIDYHVQWLRCASESHSLHVDYLGVWNERSWGTPADVISWRRALDTNGFGKTRLVLPDGWIIPSVISALQNVDNKGPFAQAVPILGAHYPCNSPYPQIMGMIVLFFLSLFFPFLISLFYFIFIYSFLSFSFSLSLLLCCSLISFFVFNSTLWVIFLSLSSFFFFSILSNISISIPKKKKNKNWVRPIGLLKTIPQ